MYRNDELALEEVSRYGHIVLSPGPGLPHNAGIMPQVIETYYSSKKILGICLGMQALGVFFGATLYNLSEPKHGRNATCNQLKNSHLLNDVVSPFEVGLYHSWAICDVKAPLTVTCESKEGVVMGIQHHSLPLYGFQFHPESILTPYGKKMLAAFLTV